MPHSEPLRRQHRWIQTEQAWPRKFLAASQGGSLFVGGFSSQSLVEVRVSILEADNRPRSPGRGERHWNTEPARPADPVQGRRNSNCNCRFLGFHSCRRVIDCFRLTLIGEAEQSVSWTADAATAAEMTKVTAMGVIVHASELPT